MATIFGITSGSSLLVNSQTGLAPVYFSIPSGEDNGEKRLMTTYLMRHVNNFQVQQKGLIGGRWLQQYPPNCTINGVDAINNVKAWHERHQRVLHRAGSLSCN